MRITDYLYMVGSGASGSFLSDELDCNCYVVDCGGELVMIDCGVGLHPEMIDTNIIAERLDAHRFIRVLLTHGHADHIGGCAYFAEKYGPLVCVPAAEAGYIRIADEKMLGLDIARNAGYYPVDYRLKPCRVDIELKAKDEFTVGKAEWLVFEASGHSIGGVCYLCRLAGKSLMFTGDHILFGGHISLQNIPGSDVHAYARTIKQLMGLDVDMLLPGHGLFCVKDGQKHIDKCAKAFENLFVPN